MAENRTTSKNLEVKGILEILPNKTGQLLDPERNGKPYPTDPFVPTDLIKRFKLKAGCTVVAKAIMGTKFNNPKVSELISVDGLEPRKQKSRFPFQQLTTLPPDDWLNLETVDGKMTLRVIDLFCPIGKGQRGLIVAPPRTGKTTLLQDIASGITQNHPNCHLMFLLVDERPEEVTDIKRTVDGELFASSNDEPLENHIRVADLAIARAKNLVETGKDVVLLLDSLTRLARAHNAARGGSGRTLTGGLDIRALEKPRQLFSSARNTEEAGSLTIVASALIETGSRMDDLIFQEFKGTGNMEMVLDRKVAELRLWPAINIAASGTRREELIIEPNILKKCHFFRRALVDMKTVDAVETALSRLSKTESNQELLQLLSQV